MTDRIPARWMCTLDERIIEHLGDESWSTPGILERRIELFASKARIRERLRLLSQAGLVAPLHEGSEIYEVTSAGNEYLKGELDARDLPDPSVRAI